MNKSIIRKRIGQFLYFYCGFFTSFVVSSVVINHNAPIYFHPFHFIIPAIGALGMVLFWVPNPIFNWFRWESKKLS